MLNFIAPLKHISPSLMSHSKSTPPKRNPSMRKLKSFFGEGTPRIKEASSQASIGTASVTSIQVLLPHESDVVKEGPANVKVELKDGKVRSVVEQDLTNRKRRGER